MPQRRPYFGMSDGEQQGAQPMQATPMSGTGTGAGDMSTEQLSTTSTDPYAEDPATLRRRLMPIAGAMEQPGGDTLSVLKQALAHGDAPQPPVPPWGSY